MFPSQIGLLGGGRRVIVIAANQTNYNLRTAMGNPPGPLDILVKIASGVVISSNNASTPAFDEGSGWASGTKIYIQNLGSIRGMGGAGGNGGSIEGAIGVPSTDVAPTNGGAGGTALKLGAPTRIENASGEVFGGGGGGGGGRYEYTEIVELGMVALGGSGGGGGRGGSTSNAGSAGTGNETTAYVAQEGNGNAGGTGSSSGAGSGGAGISYSPYFSGAGGNGGDWGTAGSAGGTAYATSGAATSGGAAGKAVDLNSQTITWISGNDSTHVKGAVS